MGLCSVDGCTASKSKCRGLSFHRVKRPADKEWQAKLVQAIGRSGKLFNIENALICSRHFEASCLKAKKEFERVLIPGSLPTLLLAKKTNGKTPTERDLSPPPPQEKSPLQSSAASLEARKSPTERNLSPPSQKSILPSSAELRKFPTERNLSPPPQQKSLLPSSAEPTLESETQQQDQPLIIIKEEMVERLLKHTSVPLPEGWTSIESTNYRDIIQVSDTKVLRRFRIPRIFTESITVYIGGGHFCKIPEEVFLGMPLEYHIKEFAALEICQGVTDESFQEYSGKDFYKEQWFNHRLKKVQSCIKSYDCCHQGKHSICGPCRVVRSYLRKRLKKSQKGPSTLGVRASLKHASRDKLVAALKEERLKNKQLEKQIERMRKYGKEESKEESVVVPETLVDHSYQTMSAKEKR